MKTYRKAGFIVFLSLLPVAACAPGPVDVEDLAVTAVTDTPQVTEGATVSLTATATGGIEPYIYRWDQNDGPVDIELSEEQVTSDELVIDSITTPGRYVFRVVVTDAAGGRDEDYVAIDVDAGATVSAAADTPEVSEGTRATLTAAAEDGSAPFSYQWNLDDGPAEVDSTDATEATWTTPILDEPGEYVFSVTATDSVGFTATATVSVEVLPVVTAEVPTCAIIDEPVTLIATIATQANATAILWEVVSGSATIENETAAEATLTATSEDAEIAVRLTVTLSGMDDSPTTTTLDFTLDPVDALHPRVLIATNFGDIIFELDGEAAPMHMENFLAYVDEGFYDGVLFHRNASTVDQATGEDIPFVLQGGGYTRVAEALELKEPTRDPVTSEADNGLSNAEVYSISMALSGLAPDFATTDPNSGTSQFFINLTDNSFLDEQGFTVFARVVGGIDVVDSIAAMETTASSVANGEVSEPVDDVIMESVTRACE